MQNLTKRQPSKFLHPFCLTCAKPVDSWLYHMEGHIDGTPLIIITCHGKRHTFGASKEFAPEFRKQMDELYRSGLSKLMLKADGTLIGPAEITKPLPTAYANNGTERQVDFGRSFDEALGIRDTDGTTK